MAHVIAIVEGPKIYYDLFLNDLEKQEYTYDNNIGGRGIIGPKVNEIHLLDITIPEQNVSEMCSDIAPFVSPTSPQKKAALMLANKLIGIISKITRAKIQKIPEVVATRNIRRKALNVMPLFWFEDQKDSEATTKWVLPKGGELL